MNVLLFPSPVTDVWTRAFGRAHSVMTVGAVGTGQYDLYYDRARDTMRDVVERLPRAWTPDFCFIASVDYYDFPLGLEDSPIPTVAVFGDYFLCFDLMRRAAPFLDLVIAVGEELIEPLTAYGANRVVALPWFGLDEETFKPMPCEKVYDVCFVGNLHPHVQRQRSKMLEKRLPDWSQRYRVFFGNTYGEDYVRVLNQSKIVFNRSILGHANMRVFETLGCGSLAMIEDTNWQTKQLFKEGEHIVVYNDENIDDVFDYYLTHDDERERIAAAGRAEALARHTYTHRAEQIVALVKEMCGRRNARAYQRNAQKMSAAERKGESAAAMFYLQQWDTAAALCEDALRQPDAPAHLWNDAAAMAAQKARAAGQFNVQTLDLMDALLQRGIEADAANPLPHFHGCVVAHQRASQGIIGNDREQQETTENNRERQGTDGVTKPQTTGQRRNEVSDDHRSVVSGQWSVVSGQWREFIARLAANPDDVPSGLPLFFVTDRFRMEWERALRERNPRRLNDLLRWQSHVFLGDALMQRQQWEDAQASYQRALEALPDDGYVSHKLGKVCQRLDDATSAVDCFERAIRQEPFFAAAQYDLACLLHQLGRDEECIALCDKFAFFFDLSLIQPFKEQFEQLRREVHQGEKPMNAPQPLTLNPQPLDAYYHIAHAFEGEPQHVRLIQQRFAAYFRGRRKVLDIGCGQGVFMEVLREQGCDPEGVDIDPEMVALARAKGFTVHCDDILAFLEQCENAYDGIYAANIIEHFNGRDATRLMQRCARALKPDGVLVMVTPNFRHPLVRDEVFWLDITHVRPYPPSLLAKMMESVGLKVADVGACPEGLNDVYIAGVKVANVRDEGTTIDLSGHKITLVSREAVVDALRYRCADAREDVVAEIADYIGASVDAVRERFERKDHDRALDERFRAPHGETTREHVENLYDTDDYVYHLMETPLTHKQLIDRTRIALSTARRYGKKSVLDFGGSGRDCIAFACFGFACVHADVAGAVRDFAAWRFQRRGLPVEIVDARSLPHRRFDVALCYDVLEHLHDPVEAIAQLCAHLNDDGLLFVFGDWENVVQGDLRHLEKNAVYEGVADKLLASAGLELMWNPYPQTRFPLQIYRRARPHRIANPREESAHLDAELTELALSLLRCPADHPERKRLQTKLHSHTPTLPRSHTDVLWEAPLFDPSGYADEARQFVLGLDGLGVRVQAKPIAWSDRTCDMDERTARRLQELLRTPINGSAVHVQHIFPPHFKHESGKRRRIGRTMFETDRIPPEWVAACNAMDEIWVPTQFNVETFARSGVKEDKLFIVHGPLDSQAYDPNLPPLVIPDRRGFNFLSVFDWNLRKGWDALLRAYVEEFSPDEDVALLLKVYSSYGLNISDIQERAAAFITSELQRDVERVPDIVFIEDILSTADMPRLFKAADAYVMPSRCEGWGRPLMEAMAMGLPTIGTRWSGNTEFMNDENSYLIEPTGIVDVPDIALQEVPNYRGHKWAEPSVEHLRQLMRYVFEHRDEAREKGCRARQDVTTKYDASVVCRKIVERLSGVIST